MSWRTRKASLLLKMKVPGGSLEFTYDLDEENAGMELQAPGDDTVHHWTRTVGANISVKPQGDAGCTSACY